MFSLWMISGLVVCQKCFRGPNGRGQCVDAVRVVILTTELGLTKRPFRRSPFMNALDELKKSFQIWRQNFHSQKVDLNSTSDHPQTAGRSVMFAFRASCWPEAVGRTDLTELAPPLDSIGRHCAQWSALKFKFGANSHHLRSDLRTLAGAVLLSGWNETIQTFYGQLKSSAHCATTQKYCSAFLPVQKVLLKRVYIPLTLERIQLKNFQCFSMGPHRDAFNGVSRVTLDFFVLKMLTSSSRVSSWIRWQPVWSEENRAWC